MSKKRSIPFEEAREFIQSQCIGSRKQYTDWHKANKPKKIPRYPNRAYAEEWDGWNDFLGTDNKFDNTKKTYRPLAEAMNWVHKLGLKTEQEWLTYVRSDENTIPENIPTRPDIVYSDWLSWMHWLGNKPREKVEAQQQVERDSSVFYCIQEKQYASESTVFTFGIERGGVSAMKENWELSHKSFRVIRMFQYDANEIEAVQQIIERDSTGYYDSKKIRIVPHISQLLWNISNHMMIAQIR